MQTAPAPTGVERTFPDDALIVTKTNLQGNITYANRLFLEISVFEEDEVVGKPHSLIRHPDMPRCVFKLLWDRLGAGKEIFAYVKNLASNGDHYWVFAHVTPSYDERGQVCGFHSSRRTPKRTAVTAIDALYRELRELELRAGDGLPSIEASTAALNERLAEQGMSYDEFIFSL